MTPETLLAALNVTPIDGVTVKPASHRSVLLACGTAWVKITSIEGDLYIYVQGLPPHTFFPTLETLRADLVEALAWSLGAEPMAPGALETRAALRAGGMWGDVVRKHLTLRLEFLTAYDLNPGLRIEVTAALLETST